MDPLTMSQQARGEDLRVVEYEAIAGAEETGQVAETAVFPALLGTAQEEHTRCRAIGQWLLGDQLLGKVVVELGDQHPRSILAEVAVDGICFDRFLRPFG